MKMHEHGGCEGTNPPAPAFVQEPEKKEVHCISHIFPVSDGIRSHGNPLRHLHRLALSGLHSEYFHKTVTEAEKPEVKQNHENIRI